MDQQLFLQVCDEVIGQQQGMNGIGTLGEKTVHSVLKSYYSPDSINHEIKVGGFVADICTGKEIIEIQTRNFNKLRRKLQAFLAFAPVTIVYPIPNIKWIRWVNPQTGEISPPRKSPKLGTPYMIFPELYWIKDFLTNPNLNLKIVLINLEEYRFLDGWSQDKKKGSTRCDRIPTELVQEIPINSLEEYQVLIPDSLGDEFTSKDFKKATGLPMKQAQTALNILHYIGAADRIGKKSRAYLYVRQNSEVSDNLAKPAAPALQELPIRKDRPNKKKVRPADDTKPAKKVRPTDEIKPSKKALPADEVKPAKKAQPADDTKPAKKTLPADDTKPAKKAQPSDEIKPSKKALPADETKPAKKARPADEVKPAKKAQHMKKTDLSDK